jgi:tetratricopeptide (TPR) repeat protein
MNEVPLNHPGDEALRALSLGQLAEAELATVYAHLSECPACCRRIDQLATDDCLLARLQQIAASREEGLVTPAQRRPAVGALRQLPDVRSATRIMKPVLFREAKGESDPVVRPSSDAMPQQSETGDRYQLFGEIARGGMGAVLRGRDRDLGRDLAVKVLLEKHANLPDVARRFVEEAQIGGQLQHPGVVPVYDIGQFGDRPFFTMKLVQGMTLAAILGEREQPTDDRPRLLNIALQVAQALAYAHAKGVIHRDLKPANIMVGAFGEVQVMDWGLAKVLKEGGAADEERAGRQDQPEEETMIRTARSSGTARSFGKETEAGWVLGTPAYMPPEQAKGEIARLDRRADVFGLGAILCEVLTGEPPYVGQSSEEVQIKAATGALAEAHARLDGSGAHPELIVLTKWCLSPEASDRPSDAQGVADGLSKYLNGVQERLQASERERAVAVVRASEEGKRRKVQLALAAALVGLLVGGGAFAFWRNEQAQVGRERDARNAEAVAALLSQCEEALRANDGAKAAVALEAATKRAAEGGAQEQAERLGRLDADLALVRDLDTIDQFRWSVVGGKLPGPAVVATRTREALSRFGADPDAVSVEEAAARVSASVVPQRIVSALDRLLRAEKRDGVRTLLRRVDAKPYRDAVRDALLADDEAKFVELVGQKAALEQPPGFVAFLGEHGAIPVQRWRQLLQAAVSQRPGDVALLITLGQTYMINQKMADQGRWWFQAAVAAAPTNATAHNNLGSALLDNGQVEEAIACYHKAIALDPKHAPAHYNLGMALAGKGQVDEAIPFYQKAIELDPKFAPAHTNLGNALMSKGKVEEAMACYRQAIAVDPKYALAHNVLGNALYGKGQHDEAIAFFHKAIELDGTIAEAHYNLGYALAAKGQHDEAIACYRQVITLAPEYAEAYHNLGAILCDIKRDYDGAIACLQKAIALKPNLAQAHYNLGLALFGKGQVDEAIACWRKVIDLDSNYAEAHCNLGEAFKTQGRFAEALAAVKRGHELGTKRRDWPYPSAAWVRYAERLAALEAQLPALLKGEFQPRDTAQRLELAGVCQVKKLHHTAAGLYAAAFAADAKLADDLNACHRYNAACHAALAAAGQGEDAAKLDDKERTRLRQQALAWLRDDLALWAKQLENGQPADHVTVQQTLKHWQQDTDLAGLRDAAALAKLPAEEQEACTQLWADVAALLKKAEEKPN